jgi:hypothetical protein
MWKPAAGHSSIGPLQRISLIPAGRSERPRVIHGTPSRCTAALLAPLPRACSGSQPSTNPPQALPDTRWRRGSRRIPSAVARPSEGLRLAMDDGRAWKVTLRSETLWWTASQVVIRKHHICHIGQHHEYMRWCHRPRRDASRTPPGRWSIRATRTLAGPTNPLSANTLIDGQLCLVRVHNCEAYGSTRSGEAAFSTAHIAGRLAKQVLFQLSSIPGRKGPLTCADALVVSENSSIVVSRSLAPSSRRTLFEVVAEGDHVRVIGFQDRQRSSRRPGLDDRAHLSEAAHQGPARMA